MKTKGFSIGIIFLVLMICTTCTTDEDLITPDGESSALKSAPEESAMSGWTTSTTGFPMIDLGEGIGYGVNSLGHVVGEAQPWDPSGAFLWSKQYGIKYLGTLGGEPSFSSAYDINDRGQIIGFSTEPEKIQLRAFLWSANGGMVNLGTAKVQDDPDNPFSMAYRINNQGEIVGETGNYAFLWTQKLGMVLLSTIQPYWKYSTAWDINENGKIVGMCMVNFPVEFHAVLWTDVSQIQDLGTMKLHSQALGINKLGEVVGGSSDNCWLHERIGSYPNNYNGWYLFDHSCVAFIWTESNGMSQLPVLEGGDASSAYAINDRGHVIGWSYTSEGKVHAFVWTSNNGIKDLGTLPGDDESVAYGINNLGQVVGCSIKMHENGINVIRHAVIWTVK